MKKAILLIIVLVLGVSAYAQNNVYGKKVVGLDSLVSDTIRARTQAAPYIEGFGTGVGGSNTEIQFNDNGVFGASSGLTWDGTSLTVDNLTLNGNTISSSTGTIDIVPTGTEDVRITNGGDLILNNSSSRIVTPRIYASSGGSASTVSFYLNYDGHTGIYQSEADHFDISAGGTNVAAFDNSGVIITGTTDTDSLYVSGNSDLVGTLDVTGNATFSGNVIASGGDIYLGASSPALTIGGGSNASSGGQIQLNGEGAGAADDIIFKASGTEVGRWDESASQWKFLNSLDVSGALSKGSGTFKITHPLDTSKWLYHSFVEAPRADNIYRGKVKLYQGAAMVGIDTASNMTVGTFDSLNHNVQVFISNNDTWDLVKGSYSNGVLSIESQNVLSHAVVDWLVIGERKDQTVIDWDLTDDKGQLIPEWDKN